MSRTCKKVDYAQALDLTVRLGDCLPPDHLARFVVDSVALLDLSALYAHYGSRGGEPYAPEVLLGLLFYGYPPGGFSSPVPPFSRCWIEPGHGARLEAGGVSNCAVDACNVF